MASSALKKGTGQDSESTSILTKGGPCSIEDTKGHKVPDVHLSCVRMHDFCFQCERVCHFPCTAQGCCKELASSLEY